MELSDQREIGRPIRVLFNGDLRLQQELAAEQLLRHSDGVLRSGNCIWQDGGVQLFDCGTKGEYIDFAAE